MNMLQLVLLSFLLIDGKDTISVSLDTLPHDTVTVRINKYLHLSGVKIHRLVKKAVGLEMMAEDGYYIIAPIELVTKNLLFFADSMDHKPLDEKFGRVFVVPLDERPHYRMFAVKKLKWIKTIEWPFYQLPDTVYPATEKDWIEVIQALPDTQLVLLMACDSMKLAFPAKFFKSYVFKHDTGTVGEFVDFGPAKGHLLNISDPAWLIIGNSKGYVLAHSPKLAMGDSVSMATLLKIIDYDVPENYTYRINDREFDFNALKEVRLTISDNRAYFERNGKIIGDRITRKRANANSGTKL